MRTLVKLLLVPMALGLAGPVSAEQQTGETPQGESDIWYEPDFNRYAIDRGAFDDGDQYGYHYEEEDEFGWYDDDFNWGVEDPEYDAWYGDADEDWDDDWF